MQDGPRRAEGEARPNPSEQLRAATGPCRFDEPRTVHTLLGKQQVSTTCPTRQQQYSKPTHLSMQGFAGGRRTSYYSPRPWLIGHTRTSVVHTGAATAAPCSIEAECPLSDHNHYYSHIVTTQSTCCGVSKSRPKTSMLICVPKSPRGSGCVGMHTH
eukprot:scaffold3803_cov22-Tisochrysis_lutea.AAC.2